MAPLPGVQREQHGIKRNLLKEHKQGQDRHCKKKGRPSGVGRSLEKEQVGSGKRISQQGATDDQECEVMPESDGQ